MKAGLARAANKPRVYAQRHHLLDCLARQRPGRDIAADHDRLNLFASNFGQYRPQRGQIAVDVVKGRDPHQRDHPRATTAHTAHSHEKGQSRRRLLLACRQVLIAGARAGTHPGVLFVLLGVGLRDTGEVGFYENQVVPRFINLAMGGRELTPIRARVSAPLAGDVLEVGFGSGLNVPHYPAAVTQVRAVDPATIGRKLATKRVAARGVPVEYTDLDGQTLSQESASIDHVLTTWTLCSIPDVDRALSEILRVLRPGGSFHFVEHGRSPDPRVSRWQDRLTPIQRRVAGGCHLNRPIDEMVRNSGLELSQLENYYAKGLRPFAYMFEGIATKP
jgi:SAM-dependent methyltransferase